MRKTIQFLIVPLCVMSLTGCASYQTMKDNLGFGIESVEQTKLDAHGNERFQNAEPIADWWRALDDEELDALIFRALDENRDVKIAIANLSEARAIAGESNFDLFPTVTARGSAARSRTSGELGTGDSRVSNNFDAGFDASWELDLFGRVSQAIDADEARAYAAQSNLNNVYVSISAEVARTYIELRGAQYRLNIAKRNANNQRNTVDLTRQLEEGGRSTALDIAQAQTQLELTQSTIPSLEALVVSNINRLSVLTGQVPQSLHEQLLKGKEMPTIPKVVNVGNVSDLLRRRPDVKRAEQNLAASIADYNVSVADQFPVVNIVGALGFAATTFGSFGASAIAASAGPSVSWAAFDMGRIRAGIDQNDAIADAALASYEKTVLEAIEELQTAVSDFSKEEQRRLRLQNAARSSKKAAGLSRTRFEAGVDTFLNVLTAEATLLEAEDTLAQSEISAALDLISVYKALGGGWQIKE